ncbi:MAG TPA: S8 family serine peptidase [Pyrinomonadaceae bacterium]|nr:S8 family serine peptidase [Pyrinomonadaceae bacterium]
MRLRQTLFTFLFVLVVTASAAHAAPTFDPALAARLRAADASKLFGVILTFDGDAVTDSQVAQLSALGITTGVRMQRLPVVAVNATRAQIESLARVQGLQSVYLNAPLELYLHQTKPLIGVTRLQQDAALTARNGGAPVSGRGVTIAINDSGVDALHPDLKFNPLDAAGSKTIQNVLVTMSGGDGLIVRADALGNPVEGILAPQYVENVPNTDTHVGHGTHVAGIAAGTGQQSGGRYAGVAPGAKIVGLGSGGVLFVLSQIAAFDYALVHQFDMNIRVVNCSWGNSAVAVDPNHPINRASRRLYDNNVVVVFANGNDGPDPNSQNRWASVPWIITAGASLKDGRIASFSSRGIFGDPVIHPTVLVPGEGGPAGKGFTSHVVAARSSTNAVANGLNSDTEIPAPFIPYYTQIQGTSMAAPHLAGVVACILEANPALTVDDVRAIIERTATPLGTYDVDEAGAGLANVHAAVDLAFNPSKPYGRFGFEGKGFAVEGSEHTSDGVLAQGATQDTEFTVAPNARFAFVQLDWGSAAGESAVVIDNTNQVLPDLSLTILRDGQPVASSNDINLSGFFGAREAVRIEFPEPGVYTARVSEGLFLGATTPSDTTYKLKFTTYSYDPNTFGDLGQLDEATRTEALRLVYDRILSADGGYFRPSDALTRMELGRALMFAARVPQFVPAARTFADLASGSPDSLVAESLRRENVIGLSAGGTYGPAVAVNRLELAVALVRALRLDNEARALAGTIVRSEGKTLTDNGQIPAHLRGYVQLALDRGLLAAFPAEFKEIAPGQIQIVPGPRFEPAAAVTRAQFVAPATKLVAEMFGE